MRRHLDDLLELSSRMVRLKINHDSLSRNLLFLRFHDFSSLGGIVVDRHLVMLTHN